MVHDVQAIREDIAFMRALAQEGRRAPLLIGRNLLAAGLVFALASVIAYAIAVHILALPRWWEAVDYWVATAVYLVYLRLNRWGCETGRPGATAVTNRAVGAVWRGIGFAIGALMVAGFLIAYETKSSEVFALFPSMVLAIYGAGWTVAAAMSEVRWLRAVAVGCFLVAAGIGATVTNAAAYLLFAAALLALAALPGWLLMRGEPSEVV